MRAWYVDRYDVNMPVTGPSQSTAMTGLCTSGSLSSKRPPILLVSQLLFGLVGGLPTHAFTKHALPVLVPVLTSTGRADTKEEGEGKKKEEKKEVDGNTPERLAFSLAILKKLGGSNATGECMKHYAYSQRL